jgi:acyl carrier protein
MNKTILSKIVDSIKELKGISELGADASLIDDGILDSFDIVNLITMLEEEFQIHIPGDEIIPENLNSIANVCALIERLISSQHG